MSTAFSAGLIDETPNIGDGQTEEEAAEERERIKRFTKGVDRDYEDIEIETRQDLEKIHNGQPILSDMQLDRAIERIEGMTDDELFDSMMDFVGSDGRGKYDGLPLKKEVTGITLDDILKYAEKKFTPEHRLILAAMLFNSCTPGRTDFTVFTDMVKFKPGLNPKERRMRPPV